ncbi:MAG: hypothetical protein A3Q59_05920 [Methanomethylophilus alvi]|nr:MAG: hypothetical protein A3Q59_05920 [Methanomethylophilus alvi]
MRFSRSAVRSDRTFCPRVPNTASISFCLEAMNWRISMRLPCSPSLMSVWNSSVPTSEENVSLTRSSFSVA